MSEKIKLLDCPFCGGPATHNDGGNSIYGRFWWTVGCRECDLWFYDREKWTKDAVLDPAYPPEESIDRWNTRYHAREVNP